MVVSAGARLGPYEILAPLGSGGMGEVWRARHVMLGRPAAVKLVRAASLGAAGANAQNLLRRFEREARATSALRSPHTVQVYDFGTTEDGSFYYVMELLEGRDLNSLVEQHGPFPAGRVIYILQQVCESLAEAHRNGLIHRDIKPGNIVLAEVGFKYDFAKVLDFGLVVHAPGSDWKESRLTMEGVIAGSPAFMAPELIRGGSTIDGRADLYSLGCVAYWLLTGQLVFGQDAGDDNPMQVIAAHLGQQPEPPSARGELEIPPELEQLVMACLEKTPERRPASADELANRLAACPVSEPWSETRAEDWWRLHHPSRAGTSQAVAAEWSTAPAPLATPATPSQGTGRPASGAGDSGRDALAAGTPTPGLNLAPSTAVRAETEPEFVLPRKTARAMFLITQVGYLAMYFAALYQAEALQQALYRAFRFSGGPAVSLALAFAMCSIAVRLYLLSSVGLNHPASGIQFRRLFPVLLLLDAIWAASPLLLVNKLGWGLPLFGVAGLAYLPFSQRTLMESIYPAGKATGSGTLRV